MDNLYANQSKERFEPTRKFPTRRGFEGFIKSIIYFDGTIAEGCDVINLNPASFWEQVEKAKKWGILNDYQLDLLDYKRHKGKVFGGESSGKEREVEITYSPEFEQIGGFDKDYKRLENYSLS